MNLSDDNKNEIKSSQMSGVLDEVDQNKTDSVQNLCGIAKKTSIGGQAVIDERSRKNCYCGKEARRRNSC